MGRGPPAAVCVCVCSRCPRTSQHWGRANIELDQVVVVVSYDVLLYMSTWFAMSGKAKNVVVEHGLTADLANQCIADEIQAITEVYRRICEWRLSPRRQCGIVWSFLCSFEGQNNDVLFATSALRRLLSGGSLAGGSVSHLWRVVVSLCLVLPYFLVNIAVALKLHRAENIRPFAQVEEALRVLKEDTSETRKSTAETTRADDFQIWDPPSSTLVTVYRDQVWRRIPTIMVARGDIFKLREGEVFPTNAVRVELDLELERPEGLPSHSTVYIRRCTEETEYAQGDVFSPIVEVPYRSLSTSTTDSSSESDVYCTRNASTDFGVSLAEDSLHTPRRSSSDFTEEQTQNTLPYSPALKDCGGLAMATFVATSFGCTRFINKFFERRKHTMFFEMAGRTRSLLIKFFVVLLLLSLVFNVVWCVDTAQKIEVYAYGKPHIALMALAAHCLQTIYLGLSFMPLVYRILIEVTDAWGNARLQSLFQWLQDTRFPPQSHLSSAVASGAMSSSLTSFTTGTASELSSVDSRMSVSRLPLRNQFSELLAVLGHGLDGAANLLHTLNATTSVVFVDKEGLLTDTQMTIQEICVAEKTPIQNSNMFCSQGAAAASSSPRILATDRVVVDVLPQPNEPDGQRFEDPLQARYHLAALRPFAALMTSTQLPLTDIHYNDTAQSKWLLALTAQDILQSDGLVPSAFRECLCSIHPLCSLPDTITTRFSLARFALAVQRRMIRQIFPPTLSPTTDGSALPRSTVHASASQAVFAMWLLRDAQEGCFQLLTKGNPRSILRRSAFYFDGHNVLPMTRSLRRSLLELTAQWKANGLECLAFGYRPLNQAQQHDCLHLLDEHSVFVVEPDTVTLAWDAARTARSRIVRGRSIDWSHQLKDVGPDAQQQLFDDVWETQRYIDDAVPEDKTQDDSPIRPLEQTEALKTIPHQHAEQQQPHHPSTLAVTLTARPSWRPINIFPGTRSSIGSAPIVKCRVACPKSQPVVLEFVNYANLVTPATVGGETNGEVVVSTYPAAKVPPSRCCLTAPTPPHVHHVDARTPPLPCRSAMTDASMHLDVRSGRDVGALMRKLTSQQVFLGMTALKMSTPQELSARIASFHEAGIRFVYMSQENNKKTKAVGALLGLDTDWNCLVSLLPSPRGVVNVVGNVVVPSGIENIRAHIREIDNVPLQVSLFSNGTPYTMREMMKVLQENGEVVMCVGSSRRSTNFDLFEQANCSMSVAVDLAPLCRQCLGRRCVGYVHRHVFQTLPVEFQAAAALISLPCALQIHMKGIPASAQPASSAYPISSAADPRWLAELLYEAFKESRRIVDATQQAIIFFVGIATGFIAPMLTLSTILFFPPFFRDVSLLSVLLVFLPILSVTLLYSPAADTIMKEYPLRLSDYTRSRQEIRRSCLWYGLRFIPSGVCCLCLVVYYFAASLPIAVERLVNSGKVRDEAMIREACSSLVSPLHMIGGKWMRCYAAYELAVTTGSASPFPPLILHTQIVCCSVMLILILPMSLSFIDRLQSLLSVPPTRNIYLIISWLVISLVYATGVCIELIWTGTWTLFIAPPYPLYIILILWIVIILAVDELVKFHARKAHMLHQKYLKLLFTTRLGMWSPK